jgi:hypothetical protein
MWEVQMSANNATGNFGQIADANFPSGFAVGTSSFNTTAAINISFRTKMESKNVKDIVKQTAFQYPVSLPVHYYISLSCLAYQDTGAAINVTPTLRSADTADTFSSMTNSLAGNALSLPSGVVTLLTWDTAANAFALDSLTNAINGICWQLDFAVPTGVSTKNLRFSDAQFEGGQVATAYNRALWGDERTRCERFYAKTFGLGTAPAQNAGLPGAIFAEAYGATAGMLYAQWYLPVQMIAPAAITTFNPSASNANWRDVTGASDVVVLVDPDTAKHGRSIPIGSQTTALTAGHRCYIHAVADARL